MEEVKVPFHDHHLRPFTGFVSDICFACCSNYANPSYIYGGYRCNEPGCYSGVFHKECIEALPEINHSSHPEHPLKLFQHSLDEQCSCSLCQNHHLYNAMYRCSKCPFEIGLKCVRSAPENSYLHDHPLKLSHGEPSENLEYYCAVCNSTTGDQNNNYYGCLECKFAIHLACVDDAPEAYHTSHPEHPLKSIMFSSLPDYADI